MAQALAQSLHTLIYKQVRAYFLGLSPPCRAGHARTEVRLFIRSQIGSPFARVLAQSVHTLIYKKVTALFCTLPLRQNLTHACGDPAHLLENKGTRPVRSSP